MKPNAKQNLVTKQEKHTSFSAFFLFFRFFSFPKLFIATFFLFAIKMSLEPSLAWSFTEENGTITQVSGEVKVWDNEKQQWKAGQKGMEVKHEDQIKTGKDSYAVLQYDYQKCDINEVPSVSTVAVSNPIAISQPEDSKSSLAKARVLKLKRCTQGTCAFSRPGVSPAVCVVGEQRIAQFKTKSWWGDTKIMK